ncbi:hypothetical protein K503DRAFT_764747 [Rhizopogon vinicolor AM-OR11-026]|uniref:Uncharacterized protein n=1 Tax=Rhizopogon vinicolor AM-OR11-026 TaxID=1314800 RepID=A0A1B7NJ09_9AGAM|nr:hypothetical protein K503DRAFT_764747 [Rhizopogon vinicolor AM-OR11-026]
MATQSPDQQKIHYSRELAAYTFRQWVAVRKSIDTQKSDASLSNAMSNISLASPGPPAQVQEQKSARRTLADNTFRRSVWVRCWPTCPPRITLPVSSAPHTVTMVSITKQLFLAQASLAYGAACTQ